MKRFLKPKLVLSLVSVVLLAGAIVVPLSGNILRSHAQGTTQETLTVPFTNGPNGATTTNSYTGLVAITVSGTGQAAGPRYSDAFYFFTDDSGNPITPEHHPDFSLCINNQPVDNYVAIPLYRSDHTYQFTISVSGPQHLTFGVCDTFTADNSGNFTIMVTGTSAQPQANISVQKIASSSQAEPGEALGYSIIVTNGGPADARNVTVSDPLPQQISAITYQPSQGSCSVSGLLLQCSLGNLANGAQAVVNVFTTVDANATLGDSLTNKATAMADNAAPKTSTTVTTRVVSPLTLEDIKHYLQLAGGLACLAKVVVNPGALVTPGCIRTLLNGGSQFIALAQCLSIYHRLDTCTGFGRSS